MSEVDDFLNETMPRLMEAERALHNGDAEPRVAMWSRKDPVTLFGAWLSDSGWDDVSRTFQVLASRFSDCTAYDVDVIAAGASGDLAYTVAYEHTTASVQGVPRTYTLRVTQIYRREDGQWKLVHRHGDELAADQKPLKSTQAT
ncbi:MAG TPA: nuclear transport factor 2 family protein [Jiangellaceae bacterium]|jgi:ketosteroid isomerase-like protein|nr:nuclear transport factor 2 family protein [Jiangellaceae bacterium]